MKKAAIIRKKRSFKDILKSCQTRLVLPCREHISSAVHQFCPSNGVVDSLIPRGPSMVGKSFWCIVATPWFINQYRFGIFFMDRVFNCIPGIPVQKCGQIETETINFILLYPVEQRVDDVLSRPGVFGFEFVPGSASVHEMSIFVPSKHDTFQ